VAENKKDARLKNYSVSVVKKSAEGKLFVDGPDERVVFLNYAYDNHHDIFIANVGGPPCKMCALNLPARKTSSWMKVGRLKMAVRWRHSQLLIYIKHR